MSTEDNSRSSIHHRIADYVLMGLTLSMFITNIILIAVLVVYSYRVTVNDERYVTLRQDYTARIEEMDRRSEIKFQRLSDSINSLQFTTNKRIDLLNDKIETNRK